MLMACSGQYDNKQSVDFSGWEKSYLIYSYPNDGQQNVSLRTGISLSFTHAIEDENLASHIRLLDADDNLLLGSFRLYEENPSGLVFTPNEALEEGRVYRLRYDGLTTSLGEVSAPKELSFTTKNAATGSPTFASSENKVEVIRQFPSAHLPFMDFSVLHLTFSQELDPSTVKINDSFKFIEQGETLSVQGKLVVKDNYIIFDPDEDLKPGREYTLSLSESVRSRLGDALRVNEYASKVYTPQNSQPRSTLVQKIDGKQGENFSPLSGFERNTVPVNSTLMGDVVSFAKADYFTELAFVPNFPESVPFVIRKGSVVTGSSMNVDIGGEIPSGFATGDTYLTLITDAIGYLVPNQYTDDPSAPSQVQIVMNVAMIAEDPKANGGLSQDVLHIDLFGIGRTENGVLVIDTLGEIKPKLLGIERATGLVSFFLESYVDQNNTPPSLQNWLPGDFANMMTPSDAILLIFDEAIAPETLNNNVSLWRDANTAVDITLTVDGSSVVVRPNAPLENGGTYSLSVGAEVADLSGNQLTAPMTKTFSLPDFAQVDLAAPLVASIYPGYSCRMTGLNLANNIAGRCESGQAGDDVFNVFKLPANQAIQIDFNQTMKPETLFLGNACGEGSVRVEEINVNGGCLAAVKGAFQFDGNRISFQPEGAWQDEKLYRITLNSKTSSACNGNDAVLCSVNNLPLRTNPLTLTAENKRQGSGPLTVPFRASEPELRKAFNPLNHIPTADVNRNFAFDNDNDIESALAVNTAKLTVAGTGGLVSEGILGCRSGECEDEKSIYLSGFFPTEIGLPEMLADGVRIPVDLHSQVLMTSSVTLYAKVLLSWLETPTGPQIMRMRPNYDEVSGESIPSRGYIEWNPDFENPDGSLGKAVFTSTLNVYLDAPGLKPEFIGIGLGTNLKSYPLTLDLYGPINFLPNGRMEILLQNTNTVEIDILIALGTLDSANVDLEIRPGDLDISLISKMIK